MLLFFNIVILALFGSLVCICCDLLDNAVTTKFKVGCYVRIILSGIAAGIVLLVLYNVYGITDDNLLYYTAYGRVK